MKLSRHLRLAFHDWMWSPKSRHPRIRRCCQRLPLYLTDPHLDGIPRDPDKLGEWFATLGPVQTVGPTRAETAGCSGFVQVQPMTTSSGQVINLRWKDPA